MPCKDSPLAIQNVVQDEIYDTFIYVLKNLEPNFSWNFSKEIVDQDERPILIFSGYDPEHPGKLCCTYCIKIKGPGHYEMWISH